MKSIRFILLITALVLASCHTHNHDDDHDHENNHDHGQENVHDHDDISLILTAYNNYFEVFAEADPFAAGKASDILVHITKLADFKPLREGRITASLVSESQDISQTSESPNRPGIYSFSLTPKETGMARLRISIIIDGTEEVLETEPLVISANAHDAIHVAEDMMPQASGAVIFTKEQSWVVDFSTAETHKQPFGPVIKTVGKVTPARGDETILIARTSGIISFAGNTFYEGSLLDENTPLLYIKGETLAEGNAAIRYKEAKNNFEQAEANFKRISSLATDKIVSEKELLQAKNEYRNALTVYESLRQYFSESGQTIVSPWRGYLKELFVEEGQFVSMGQPLASLIRNREMVIRADVQQQYAYLLNNIEDIHIGTNGMHVHNLSNSGGKVLSVSPNLNPETNMLAVHIQIDNTANMIPGSLVDVYLKSVSQDSLVVVPNTALIEEQGNYFSFVQVYPESFEKRQVQIKQNDGVYTAIAHGLNEGERIVTNGAIMIKLAAGSGDLDPHAGHIH